MGYISSRARKDFLPVNITLHLLLVASVVIAMSAKWAQVNFDVRDPTWVTTTGPDATSVETSATPFKCPTHTWYLFAYNGFCKFQRLDDGSRGKAGQTDCLTWNNDKQWRHMNEQNIFGADFFTGREQWQATCALLALSLFLTLVTLLTTWGKACFSPMWLGVSTLFMAVNFLSILLSWVLALTSAQMVPNNWDGMLGCGNSSFAFSVGFGFAVAGSFLAGTLFFLLAVATVAEGISRFHELYEVKERQGGLDETKYDAGTRAEDRQVQGYRPDIVA